MGIYKCVHTRTHTHNRYIPPNIASEVGGLYLTSFKTLSFSSRGYQQELIRSQSGWIWVEAQKRSQCDRKSVGSKHIMFCWGNAWWTSNNFQASSMSYYQVVVRANPKICSLNGDSSPKMPGKKPATNALKTPSRHKQQPKPPFANYSRGGRFHWHRHRKLHLFRDLDDRSWSPNENICCDISRILCEIADVHGDVKVECVVILTFFSAMKDQVRLRWVLALLLP